MDPYKFPKDMTRPQEEHATTLSLRLVKLGAQNLNKYKAMTTKETQSLAMAEQEDAKCKRDPRPLEHTKD